MNGDRLRTSTRRRLLAVAASAAGHRWVRPATADPASPKWVKCWGEPGDQPGQFHSPIGLALGPDNTLFVSDLNNSRIQLFNLDGGYLGGFELPWDTPPRRSCIVGGIAVGADGVLYVSFMVKHRLAVYSKDGKLLREWGKLGSGPGEFHQPGGIVVRSDRTLYVTDQCNHRVQHFTQDGKFLDAWGQHGSLPGRFGGAEPAGSRFGGPHFLAQDRDGDFFTTEGVLGRVQHLTPDGKPLGSWVSKGSEPGGFGSYPSGYSAATFGPIGVTLDPWGRVWVSSLNSRVQCFTPEGKFLFAAGEPGSEPGQWNRPHGLVCDKAGHLYVADASNQRIQKFRLPQPRTP